MHLPAALSLRSIVDAGKTSGLGCIRRTLNFSGIVLDLNLRRGFVGHRDLGLSPAEFAVMQKLFTRPGVALTKEAIRAGLPVQVDLRMIDVYVQRARKKLATTGMAATIVTVPGRGYMACGSNHGSEDLGPTEPPIWNDRAVALAPG